MRLMRVMKLVKKIPQLQMIVMGLIGGMQSISYILLLLTIVLYLFAIMGIYAFGLNDTFHFGNLNVAMFSCTSFYIVSFTIDTHQLICLFIYFFAKKKKYFERQR